MEALPGSRSRARSRTVAAAWGLSRSRRWVPSWNAVNASYSCMVSLLPSRSGGSGRAACAARQSAVAPTKVVNVPLFLPFRGLRYRGLTDVSAVAAPPYDVIHGDERSVLASRDPHNAVR